LAKHPFRVLDQDLRAGNAVSVRVRGWIVLCGLLLALTGCQPPGPGSAVAEPTGAAQGGARQQLDTLTVAAWGSMAHYSRDRFPHWISQGGGCDTRDKVLQRDGQSVRTGSDCAITAGTWVSPYDGKTVTDPRGLDIDHLVPLADAWRTGAAAWTDAQREAFANDLTRPQLVAVTASSNRSKGDQDPSQWKPPNMGYWCPYAQNWIAVKAYWHLSVTTDEKSALAQMLGSCS
jgi:hypothetical protein